ncbi:MAG: nitroreductase family protein [Patescibacteria group bacterium]|nr:nitroreductase family protein [Patescibacteria group bacterium]
MQLAEAIKKRRSQRSFLAKEVLQKVVEELLELANLAPSANNLQNRNFIVITDQGTKDQLCEAAFNQGHVKEAPVVIAFTTNENLFDPKVFLSQCQKWGTDLFGATVDNYQKNKKFMANWQIWTKLWPIQDVDAAIITFMLAAMEKGLGTCWIGLFDYEAVTKILGLVKGQKVVSMVCLGYPKDTSSLSKRKSIKELIHWENLTN